MEKGASAVTHSREEKFSIKFLKQLNMFPVVSHTLESLQNKKMPICGSYGPIPCLSLCQDKQFKNGTNSMKSGIFKHNYVQ